MANNENLIPIPGRLHSVATEGHVAGADEIYDDSLSKDQATINAEVQAAIGTGGSVDTKIANAINALDATASQSAVADGLALSITEENGKITAISGSIAPNTYDANGAATTAKTEVIGGATSSGNTLKKLEDRVSPLETAVGSGGSIDTRISNAVAAETAAREAADTALDGRIDTLEDVVEDCAYIGENDGTAVIADFDPQTDTVWKKAQTLSNADKAQVKTNLGLPQEIYSKTEVNELVSTPHQNYVTVATYSELPASGSTDTIYRVSNYDGTQVAAGVYSEYAWNGSAYVFLAAKSSVEEVFDISEYHAGAKYADLAAALDSNNGGGVPQTLQKGGMSVKFVSNSDNKYVSYRLMTTSFSTTESDWQGVDGTVAYGSSNLIISGATKKAIDNLGTSYLDAELSLKPLYNDFYENSVILGSPYYDRLTLIASKTLLKGHTYTIIVKLENAENIRDGILGVDVFSTNDLTDFNFVDEHISGLLKNHKQELAFKGYKFDYTPSADANYLGLYLNTTTDGLQFSTFIYEEKAGESVKFVNQELTLAQKKQARTNIGVEDDLYLSNHIIGSPFYQNQELIVEYPFKKGHTYIIHISTNANITNGIYSLTSKDPFTIAEENLFFIGDSPSDLVYAFKPIKDAIGLGTWIQYLDGKYVDVTIYDKTPEDVTYVIVDADICGDIDDLFAMRVLAQAEKQGKIVLVGINVSQPATQTAAGLDGFFCHEGISDICLGLDSTATVSGSRFLNECMKHYHTYTDNSDLEDSLDWYERALNFIPDNSKAIFLTLGYYTSIVRLFSDAALKSLFQRKINHIYCMGGNFVNSSYNEYNFQYNVENTRTFISQCPVPIYFVGFETCGNVMGGKVLGERGYTFDLMQMALRAFYNNQYDIDEPMERNAPDAVAAMIACVDDMEYFNLKYVKGTVSINNSGGVTFTASAGAFTKLYAVWVNETEDYPYELWKKTMEMKLSHIMARDNEGLHTNVVRLSRV